MGNIIGEGAVVAVIGLGTVFAVLIILWGVLEFMRAIFSPKEKKDTAPAVEAEAPAPVAEPMAAAPKETADEMDEDELAAVLTAAIAASLGTSTYKLKIQSYRQIDSHAPVWNSVSRRENLASRL